MSSDSVILHHPAASGVADFALPHEHADTIRKMTPMPTAKVPARAGMASANIGGRHAELFGVDGNLPPDPAAYTVTGKGLALGRGDLAFAYVCCGGKDRLSAPDDGGGSLTALRGQRWVSEGRIGFKLGDTPVRDAQADMHVGPPPQIAPERQPDRIDAIGLLTCVNNLAADIETAIAQFENRLRVGQPLRASREAACQGIDIITVEQNLVLKPPDWCELETIQQV